MAAVHRVVVSVGVRSGLTIRRGRASLRLENLFEIFLLMLVQEGCSRHLLVYGEFRVGHEVVDGVLVLGFLNTFVEGTMERFDHLDLHQGKDEKRRVRRYGGEDWPAEQGTGGLRRETKPNYKTLLAQQPKPNARMGHGALETSNSKHWGEVR